MRRGARLPGAYRNGRKLPKENLVKRKLTFPTSSKIAAAASLLGLVAALLPLPAVGRGLPTTLADARRLGAIDGSSAGVDPSFPIDYLGVSWTSGKEPSVRFLEDGKWTSWSKLREDDLPSSGGRTFSTLLSAGDADAFQLRGTNRGVRAVAINTTDGDRPLDLQSNTASASHVSQPGIISRSEWGANESYRFNSDGSPKSTPTFYPTKKLIVHHTATRNNDPDPAATVRAIYYYHTVEKGWDDIGYNFLVDEQGRIYKGRYSGPAGTRYQDTVTGEDTGRNGVTGAHTAGANAGTMGISVLGTYSSTRIPSAARSSLVKHLAWEAERHALDPRGISTYTNPVSGFKQTAYNISGHRDWGSTTCPGEAFYGNLAAIRDAVAAALGYKQVVDNGDTSRFTASTNWSPSSSNPKRYGFDYHYATPKLVRDPAKFKVRIPETDDYAVYAWWPASSGYNSSTPIGIDTTGGRKWVRVDQRTNGGTWVYLGTFRMNGGDSWSVRVSRSTRQSGYVIADAVKVVQK